MNPELQVAERAFQEAITNAYPADLIKRLYDDLRVARDNAKHDAKRQTKRR